MSANSAAIPRDTPTAEMNSDTTTSAPKRRHSRRKGDSDTPAIGARKSGTSDATRYGNCMRNNVMARCVASNQSLPLWRPTSEERRPVQLREFFSKDAVNLQLTSTTKDEVLKELIALLKLDDKADATLYKMLRRRETLGSTGIGQGIAIPHCRSLVVSRLRVAFGRKLEGIDFKAIDDRPVHYFFLIVAPPPGASIRNFPASARTPQFPKEPKVPTRSRKPPPPGQSLKRLAERENIPRHP